MRVVAQCVVEALDVVRAVVQCVVEALDVVRVVACS